jgi:hypothetical protein
VDWIYIAPDRGQWRDFVNMVMNIRISQEVEFSYPAGRLLASQ